MTAPFRIQGDDDMEVSSRLLDILKDLDVPEGAWDGLIGYVYGDQPEHDALAAYYAKHGTFKSR